MENCRRHSRGGGTHVKPHDWAAKACPRSDRRRRDHSPAPRRIQRRRGRLMRHAHRPYDRPVHRVGFGERARRDEARGREGVERGARGRRRARGGEQRGAARRADVEGALRVQLQLCLEPRLLANRHLADFPLAQHAVRQSGVVELQPLQLLPQLLVHLPLGLALAAVALLLLPQPVDLLCEVLHEQVRPLHLLRLHRLGVGGLRHSSAQLCVRGRGVATPPRLWLRDRRRRGHLFRAAVRPHAPLRQMLLDALQDGASVLA
mmetsp:Transcript_28734/g.71605  ORF Transcript_28734/g.71605 Transcript_28734/m.71605 type:complete len:262 (-) Transcript_28734:427-1212(-)